MRRKRNKIFTICIVALFCFPVNIHAGVTSTQKTVSTTSTTLFEAAPSRAVAVYLNQSSTEVFVCWAETCTTATGTRFQENQGYIAEVYKGAISAITSSGTATLGLYEHTK